MNSKDNKQIFADNLKFQMDKVGVSRNELADALNIKYSTLSDWLNAKTYPRIDKIELLSEYFKVSKSYLIEINSENLVNEEKHYQPMKQLSYFFGLSEEPPQKSIDNKFTRFLSKFFESDEDYKYALSVTHPDEYTLLESYWALNEEGQKEAKKYMDKLAKIDDYKINDQRENLWANRMKRLYQLMKSWYKMV